MPAPAEVGQVAESTTALDMHVAIGGAMSTEVAVGMEIATDVGGHRGGGGWRLRDPHHPRPRGVTDLPDGADEADVPCVGVTGCRSSRRFDAAGNTGVDWNPSGKGSDRAETACVEQLSSTQSQAAVVFPAEPVGPGASWSADLVTVNEGVEVPVTYHYTLTAVSGGRYSIDATLDAEFEVDQGGVAVTGTMTGAGTTDRCDRQSAGRLVVVRHRRWPWRRDRRRTSRCDLDISIDMQAKAPAS